MEWIGSLDGDVNAVIRPQVTGYLDQAELPRRRPGEERSAALRDRPAHIRSRRGRSARACAPSSAARYETARANLARDQAAGGQANAVSQKDLDDSTGAPNSLGQGVSLTSADAALKTARN
jgi:membrane fusion protein (multidrug efflux system)